MTLVISQEDPFTPDVKSLLQTHLDFCHEVTPAAHSYALDVEKLRAPGITVFAARKEGALLGVGALKVLEPGHAELKSMHTAKAARGKGVGRAMVAHILAFASAHEIERVSLETGSHAPYAPARTLYEGFGFKPSPAFGDYTLSEFNVCMTLLLKESF
jgi:putative acetyltransferase